MLTFFPLSFFLVLKILSYLRFLKTCVLWISWMVISSIISYNFDNHLICVFVILSFTPCKKRQFLLDHCSWQSKILSTWIKFSLRIPNLLLILVFFYFCFWSTFYSSIFSFMNLIDSLISSSFLAHLIWESLVEEKVRKFH